jgi:predicted membrane channel-forming protein YqfA (hemolysin III family)
VDVGATPGLPGRGRRILNGEQIPLSRGLVHLAGLVMAVPAAAALLWRHGPHGGVAIYGAALIGLYAVSASYRASSSSTTTANARTAGSTSRYRSPI